MAQKHNIIMFSAALDPKENFKTEENKSGPTTYNFHLFHFLIQAGSYSGSIPFKLKFHHDIEGAYKLERMKYRKVYNVFYVEIIW